MVEAQHRISTRKLVDSDREQAVLEQLLESAKPPVPPASNLLHYLLFTPFRYPPLPNGSRFGTRWDRGIWYGAETLATAFAEVSRTTAWCFSKAPRPAWIPSRRS